MNYILFLNAFQQKYRGITDKSLLFNYLREELQYLILGFIFTRTRYPIYFLGGTQLRLSYKINRFSEDIDFALDKPNPDFPAHSFFETIASCFSEKVTGFRVKTKTNTKSNVVKIMFSFGHILYDLRLAPLLDETIKIKIEVDINPARNATYDQKQYRSFLGDYRINVHDLSTSFAGKLGAILCREYQKGRDYYDLQWYVQQTPPISINLAYFKATSAQQGKPTFKNTSALLKAVIDKVSHIDLSSMKKDLERFVVMSSDSFHAWILAYKKDTLALLDNYAKNLES